ncbi:MAG: CidA/LrgA family protein [Alphaproteobacteria bacterium]|nr:MAG: CidA/LrgA family protein [Alphaproteobacteria bacterium]
MARPLSAILLLQLMGEVVVRATGLPVPGPVLGMVGLLAVLFARPATMARVSPIADGLLRHLSVLFVPAGVGVVGHVAGLGRDGPALFVALVVSTALAIAAGAATFAAVARLLERRE